MPLPGDDLVLDLSSQHHKIGIVTSYLDQQVSVSVRAFLLCPQCLWVDDVDPQAGAAGLTVGS